MGTIRLYHMFSWVVITLPLLRTSTAPVVAPSRLVVEYGGPATANCTTTNTTNMGWEATEGGVSLTEGVRSLPWAVETLTDWNIEPKCFTYSDDTGNTESGLDITVYKRPDRVSVAYVGHSGPVVAGQRQQLRCDIQNLAPLRSLTVAFYRARHDHHPDKIFTRVFADANEAPEKSVRTPVNASALLDVAARAVDDGAQYWCEATMELGPEGPHPPPVHASDRLPSTVYYEPRIETRLGSARITEGDTLQLTCRASGNPPPSYHWSIPPTVLATHVTGENLTLSGVLMAQGGEYTCLASNAAGNDTVTVTVEVEVDLLPILAGLAAAFVVILMVVACFIYCTHYRHTRMGHYQLRDILPPRKNKQAARPNGMDHASL